MKKRSTALVKMLSLTLVLAMGLSLAACNNDSQGGNTASPDAFVYVAEYESLSSGTQDLYNSVYHDGALYYTSYVYPEGNEYPDIGITPFSAVTEVEDTDGVDDIENADADNGEDEVTPEDGDGSADEMPPMDYPRGQYKLFKLVLETGEVSELAGYVPMDTDFGAEGSITNSYIQSINIAPDGYLWVSENTSAYHISSEGDYVDDGSLNTLRKLDLTGAEISSVDLSMLADEQSGSSAYGMMSSYRSSFYVSGFAIDKDGKIIIGGGNNSIYVLDSEGKLLYKIEGDDSSYVEGLVQLADGRVAARVYERGMSLKILDTEAKKLGDSFSLGSYNVNQIYPGGGDYDIYYTDQSNLYGYKFEGEESTKIVNWISCDIDSSYMSALVPLDDGRILCILDNYEIDEEGMYHSKLEMATLVKKPASEVEERVTLTMAMQWMDWNLRREIIKFNKTNGKYRIEVIDYSEYNTQEDYNAGRTKMNTEIISGNVPDLLLVDDLPLQQYVSKGLFEDLYNLIDNDPDLKRDDFIENVLKAQEVNGGLYQISPTFSIMTIVGRSDIVGPEIGWTIDELMAVMAEHPDSVPFANMERSTMMYYFSAYSLNQFINWSTGECKFDTPDFVKLLEFVNSFPSSIDWEHYEELEPEEAQLRNGKALLMTVYLYDFNYPQLVNAIFNSEVTYKGFPAPDKNGTVVNSYGGVAISSKCKDKEGAWEFLRGMLTEEYYTKNIRGGDFPINKAAMDGLIEDAMKIETYTDENGEEQIQTRGSWGYNDIMVEILPSTQEQIDNIMAVINSASITAGYNSEIMDIINLEAESYFSGQKTAQAVATLIQGRVSTFVNEQR